MSKTKANKPAFIENVHFYKNKEGRVVLTSLYLLERGFCCKNTCKHCPY